MGLTIFIYREIKFHFDTRDFVTVGFRPVHICAAAGKNPLRSRETQTRKRAGLQVGLGDTADHQATSKGGARSVFPGTSYIFMERLEASSRQSGCWGGCHSNSQQSGWQSDSSQALCKVCGVQPTLNTEPVCIIRQFTQVCKTVSRLHYSRTQPLFQPHSAQWQKTSSQAKTALLHHFGSELPPSPLSLPGGSSHEHPSTLEHSLIHPSRSLHFLHIISGAPTLSTNLFLGQEESTILGHKQLRGLAWVFSIQTHPATT